MPLVSEILSALKLIEISPSGPRVEHTVATELAVSARSAPGIERSPGLNAKADGARIAVVTDTSLWKSVHPGLEKRSHWMLARKKDGAGGEVLASHEHLLYGLWTHLKDEWAGLDASVLREGKIAQPAFQAIRPVFDLFLTQTARTVRDFDREEHMRSLARMGASHAEVNGLAFAVPFERGPKGELLHRFYTYCPALDQFVTSRLNKNIYDNDYLQANLNMLKANAALAEKYGLTAGMVCFEPRSVPDELLDRYPVLRGARVDHPMRSFKPRYNLSVAHPVVLEHYAEMMENLVQEVPRLDYISIWSNDSGAGFEYTNSLYVGRNGGGYLVREWLAAKDIASAAALNLIRFMKTLRDAGRKINPRFRTLIRLEPFWEEHDYIWEQLEDGLDVEVSSLLTKGWDLAYKHPKYEEVPQIHGTALYSTFVADEQPLIRQLQKKGSQTDVYFVPGPFGNHEPLIGIPFPSLVYQKLKQMSDHEVATATCLGGTVPQSFAPYYINQEVVRAFQFDRSLDLPVFLRKKAKEYIGDRLADDLVIVWNLCDETYQYFPIPIWIYAAWGVWYRLFVRPIIPNIEKIPEADRVYYEDFLLATTHNRTRVDFRYDVGFDLMDSARAWLAVRHMDEDLFPRMKKILDLLVAMKKKARTDAEHACVTDQFDRMRALNCWYRTQRSVTAWVAGVHGYLESKDEKFRNECRTLLRQMVLEEIENTRDLLDLWETSTTNWMIISDVGETTFIYYKNIGEQMKKKIALMTGRENDEPYVDPDFQWRVPGFTH